MQRQAVAFMLRRSRGERRQAALTSRSNVSVEHGIVTCVRSGARQCRRRVGAPDIEEIVGCQCHNEAA